MAITSIARNFDGDPNIVTIVSNDTLATITTTGYLTGATILQNIKDLQNGEFQWTPTDLCLIYYSPAQIGFFTRDATNNDFIAISPSGGLANTLSSAQIFVGNGSNIATGVAMSGDIAITNAGVTSIGAGVVVNADINAAAAIDFSKLAALTSGRLLVGSAGNVPTAVAMSGDATMIASGAMTIANNAITTAKILDANVTLAKLSAGIAPSHVVKFAGKQANGGGSATIAITVTGALSSDIAFANIQGSTNAVNVQRVTPTADTVTVLLSGDPGAATTISYQVLRAAV
jgi:hypothetical protein